MVSGGVEGGIRASLPRLLLPLALLSASLLPCMTMAAVKAQMPSGLPTTPMQLDEGERRVFAALQQAGQQMAREEDVPVYYVYSQAILCAIVRMRPADLEELSAIKGMGEKKSEKYGREFLNVLELESANLRKGPRPVHEGQPKAKAKKAKATSAKAGAAQKKGKKAATAKEPAVSEVFFQQSPSPSEPPQLETLQAAEAPVAKQVWAPAEGVTVAAGLLGGEGGVLNPEQAEAVRVAASGGSFFLTGGAGTGKSFVLREIVEELRRMQGPAHVHVTASTGSAAVLVGGTTVHFFAGIGQGTDALSSLMTKVRGDNAAWKRLTTARALVIDEVSMISAELFTKLDGVLKLARNSTDAFGGLQVVLCGDFFQLPPVKADGFAFESPSWAGVGGEVVELTRVVRQGDAAFVRVLNEARWGNLSQGSVGLLQGCLGRVFPNDGIVPTKLFPLNHNVRSENDKHLAMLPGTAKVFRGRDDEGGERGRALARTAALDKLIDLEITLKIGAQVMCKKNIDVPSGLCNGARGVVVRWGTLDDSKDELLPVVRFACGIERVMGREDWWSESVDSKGESSRHLRKQVPLSLAWAVTVHKSQGMSLDRVEARLGQSFGHGMIYVALSRVRSLEGLKLTALDPSKATAEPRVAAFYRDLMCEPPWEGRVHRLDLGGGGFYVGEVGGGGQPHGRGRLSSSLGAYVGEFRGGVREGAGRCVWRGGVRGSYEGLWEGGRMALRDAPSAKGGKGGMPFALSLVWADVDGQERGFSVSGGEMGWGGRLGSAGTPQGLKRPLADGKLTSFGYKVQR